MPLRTAIKLYPKAIAWSLLISSTIIMEGYDVALLGNFCEYFGLDAEVVHALTGLTRQLRCLQSEVWGASSRWNLSSPCQVASRIVKRCAMWRDNRTLQ